MLKKYLNKTNYLIIIFGIILLLLSFKTTIAGDVAYCYEYNCNEGGCACLGNCSCQSDFDCSCHCYYPDDHISWSAYCGYSTD